MSTKSIFAAVHKFTKTFSFLIPAETKEQSEQIFKEYLGSESQFFEIVEPSFTFSNPFLHIQQLNAASCKDVKIGLAYCGGHLSNY